MEFKTCKIKSNFVENYMIDDRISKEITNSFNSEFESLIIQGLKLKGFEFENKNEIELFIQTRCNRVNNIQEQRYIYYVDNIPFLLHSYKIDYSSFFQINDLTTITANYGSYSFL
jgi:hypothetical protein